MPARCLTAAARKGTGGPMPPAAPVRSRPSARAGFRLAAAVSGLLRGAVGWYRRQAQPIPITISVQNPCGTWVPVLDGPLHEDQMALALADQQRLHANRPMRVCHQETGEVFARS